MATQLQTTDAPGQVPATLSPAAEHFQLMQRKARTFAMSPLVPDHLRKGSPEQAIANCYIALTLAEAMGEVPLIVMQNIHIVNGKAGFASQYMIARANSSGVFIGRIDWRIDKSDPNNLSVTAYAVLKETGQEVSVTCDMKMAKAEQWTKNPKYSSMPEVMLRYRSAAFLVRFYAPDVMLGYQTSDEVEDVVIAAGPDLNAAPLTVAAIEHQANGAPGEDDLAVVDAEVVEENSGLAPEGRSDDQHGDQHDGDEAAGDHPARALADNLIERCGKAAIIGDVMNVEGELLQHGDAMPEDLVGAVEQAIADAKARLKGSAK